MKKKLLLILFVFMFIYLPVRSESPWRRLIAQPTFDLTRNPLNPNTMFCGGVGRRVFRSFDGGLNWDTTAIGGYISGAALFNNIIMHPRDTNIVLLGGLSFSDVRRTTDNGNTWEIVLQRTRPVALNGKSMMFKPDAPDTIYVGDYTSGIMFRSINKGATFDSLTTIMEHNLIKDTQGNIKDTLLPIALTCTGIRNDSTNILFAGDAQSKMFISTDGGYNWRITDTLTIPLLNDTTIYQGKPVLNWADCEVTRITFSNRDPLVGYAVITYLFLGNLNNGGLYKTTNGGYKWKRVAFTDTSIWAVSARGFDSMNDEVYIGGYTEDFYEPEYIRVPGVGIVRRSLDGGNTWNSYDNQIDWVVDNPLLIKDLFSIDSKGGDTTYACGQDGLIVGRFRKDAYSWKVLNSITARTLRSVNFVDKRYGFVAGDNGTILKTNDAGVTWIQLNSGTSNNLKSIFFIDYNHGYVVGDGGLILSTTDGGNTWHQSLAVTTANLTSVYFVNSTNGYAAGLGTILKTVNSGADWTVINPGTDVQLKSIWFTDLSTGVAVGDNGTILRSSDGGDNWTQIPFNINLSLNGITFVDNNTAYVSCNLGKILKSTDKGLTWNLIQTQSLRNFYSVSAANPDTVFVCGFSRTSYWTTDAGAEWYFLEYGWGSKANMWSLRYFGVPGHESLYMSSEAGLFVNDKPGPVFEQPVTQDPNAQLVVAVSKDKILRIFYNKSNPNSSQPLQFRMIDLLGRQVISKDLQNSTGISIQQDLDAQSLISGVYLCQVVEGSNIATYKIVIE